MTNTEGKPPLNLTRRVENGWLRLQRDWRIDGLNKQVKKHANPPVAANRVAFFNASTRLGGFSQNAAFSLLTSWGLQLAGVPVVNFGCSSGMTRCVLGTNPDDVYEQPPCQVCIAQSRRLYKSSPVYWFENRPNPALQAALEGQSIERLSKFEWRFDPVGLTIQNETLPLGQMVLSSLRWALRRHHFTDDEPTRFLLKAYIQSAYRVAAAFDEFITQTHPKVVVVFNGTMYPEAAARWVGLKHGLRVVTHEVGFQPFSAFFTDGQATAYPMDIPPQFVLSPEQNTRLDNYLSHRFKGEFSMAGIRFWPQISGLGEGFLNRAAQFKQVVPIFTNVINDTSQVHACTVFSHMYDWLESVMTVTQRHHETLFIIRAHPDEKRRGTQKHSRQPVSDWVAENGIDRPENVLFIDSNEPLSSYELIRLSKFVIVYNSSIGLEAALLGIPVLCGGKARYTQVPTVFFPKTPEAYQQMTEDFLAADRIEIPDEFQLNARRILYWQLFRTALPFENFINAHPTPGYVQLRRLSYRDLLIKNSTTIGVLVDGITKGDAFILPGNEPGA